MPGVSEPQSAAYWTELRIFLQVATERSFNKAALSLGVTHPTVGRAVRRLEDELGTALVAEAYARGVKLTAAGERLARQLAKVDRQIAGMLARFEPS